MIFFVEFYFVAPIQFVNLSHGFLIWLNSLVVNRPQTVPQMYVFILKTLHFFTKKEAAF